MSVELPTAAEVAVIAGYAAMLPEKADTWEVHWSTTLTAQPLNPWLLIDFAPTVPVPVRIEPLKLALWRASREVYAIGRNGAVDEDPLTPQTFAAQFGEAERERPA